MHIYVHEQRPKDVQYPALSFSLVAGSPTRSSAGGQQALVPVLHSARGEGAHIHN